MLAEVGETHVISIATTHRECNKSQLIASSKCGFYRETDRTNLPHKSAGTR